MEISLKVLFIDRDPSVAATVAVAMKQQGSIDLNVAGSYDLAECHLHSGSFDVLVVDIRTPRSGIGSEFIARFAERYACAGIVLVSADPDYYRHFYPAYSVCLQKPYDLVQLMGTIQLAWVKAPRE